MKSDKGTVVNIPKKFVLPRDLFITSLLCIARHRYNIELFLAVPAIFSGTFEDLKINVEFYRY